MARYAPPRLPLARALAACTGIFVAIATLGLFSFEFHILLALGSFGSSAVLLFCFPENDFSQPRSIVGGHLISTAVGLTVLALAGQAWWAMGLAVALAAGAMIATRTVHPPAGSNPIIVFLGLPGWDFLLFPTFSGALVLVAVGCAWHRLARQAYPQYWLGLEKRWRWRTFTALSATRTSQASSRTR